ncbi:MAG: M15 family metallopeptidase, partial [Oscillospiraceae bacterium]|nr:M15 family metallopeptidase [Oscillospiraceae bacterium]
NNGNGDSGSNDNGDEVTPPANLGNGNMTRDEKMLFLFGETVKDPRYYYNGNQAATEADMVDVWVKAWDLKKNGEKYTRDWKLKVHKNLADTVKAIFEEIYNGPEKFPIHDMYCYAWVGKSEHTIGTAIDINYNENYYCEADGTPITGDYWKPGEDPYSIPPNGDVAKAFAKYGYIWGINWTSGKKDYMHFSFFGT